MVARQRASKLANLGNDLSGMATEKALSEWLFGSVHLACQIGTRLGKRSRHFWKFLEKKRRKIKKHQMVFKKSSSFLESPPVIETN
jgi:hypothetical protein